MYNGQNLRSFSRICASVILDKRSDFRLGVGLVCAAAAGGWTTGGGSGFANRSDTLISGGLMTGGVATEPPVLIDGFRSFSCRMTSSWLPLRAGSAGLGRSMDTAAGVGGMGFNTEIFRCTAGDCKIRMLKSEKYVSDKCTYGCFVAGRWGFRALAGIRQVQAAQFLPEGRH